MEKERFWLFIIPENYYFGLWEKCLKDNVLACEYLPSYHGYTVNINMLREIQEGDRVVAYLNDKTIGGYATVTHTYFDANEDEKYPYGDDGFRQRIGVKFDQYDSDGCQYEGRIRDLIGLNRLHIKTIHELTARDFTRIEKWWNYRNYVEPEIESGDFLDETVSSNDFRPESVSLELRNERQLRNYLSNNLEELEPGLKIHQETNRNGIEYRVKAGFIDILAIDKQGQFVVIELKRETGDESSLGQLLAYMGSLKEEKELENVRGILVAQDFNTKVRLAINVLPNIKIQSYDLEIRFPQL
ncbi:MAG: DUF91 domain-containing protein [bacterium]|nr:MAG: DUF91 domain-containing protein [bacterium]